MAEEEFGNYLLVEHLGRGGMADVFKAKLTGLAGFSRYVVVKRILRIYTEEQRFVDMFINEAKIAARLSHPNIIHIYELGQVEGVLFIAMEYVRGQDLVTVLRAAHEETGFGLPPLIAAYILREVLAALAHAHSHTDEEGVLMPIIHRDVSPQNIMISVDGQIKLVDFGIAKAVSAMQEGTRTIILKGKMGYMAPEQLRTGACTPKTDLFSAGVVLHELLTGERLFTGQTDFETMTNVVTGPLLPPSARNPTVPQALERICLKALARNPADRYESAAQMGRELDMVLQEARFSMEQLASFLALLGSIKKPGGESGDMPGDVSLGSPRRLPPSGERPPLERRRSQEHRTALWFATGLASALLLLWLGGRLFSSQRPMPLLLGGEEPPVSVRTILVPKQIVPKEISPPRVQPEIPSVGALRRVGKPPQRISPSIRTPAKPSATRFTALPVDPAREPFRATPVDDGEKPATPPPGKIRAVD